MKFKEEIWNKQTILGKKGRVHTRAEFLVEFGFLLTFP